MKLRLALTSISSSSGSATPGGTSSSTAGGCAIAPPSARTALLPLIGLALGAVLVARRRRARR